MPNLRKQSYLKRDFNSVRQDLIDILKIHFPEQWQDFNSASAGMSLLELLAYVSDLLSFHTDKRFNELFLDTVSERTSIFRLARTFGYDIPGVRPAIALSDFIIEVPPTANGPDSSYLPVYRPGVQVKGGGQIFETVEEIDFSSDFSENGTANRKIEPIFNANQDILRYRITKRELVKAGVTKIFQREINFEEAATEFMEIVLPDSDVLEILSVIAKSSVGITATPSFQDFANFDIRYFEVSDLAENKVFIEDDSQTTVSSFKIGRTTEVNRRFTKNFLSDGSCQLTFGGGTPNYDAYESYLASIPLNTAGQISIAQVFDNKALGEKLPSNSTLFVKFRVGGGPNSNVGANVLTQVGNINAVILGSNPTLNQSVISSTRTTNIIAAIGGESMPSVDEIKYQIASNFASQKRGVTLNDYIARAFQMPGKFGAPFRISGKIEDNKVKFYILSRDANGKILTTSTNIIKNNIVEYMIPYRMINDFIEVNDGKVIDLSIEIDIFVDKNFNSSEVKSSVLNVVRDFFNIEKIQMNQTIYISQITDIVRDVSGVINVIDIRLYNMEGGSYSRTLIAQATGARELTKETNVFRTLIEPIDNAIFSTPVSLFEIRFAEKDIRVRIS